MSLQHERLHTVPFWQSQKPFLSRVPLSPFHQRLRPRHTHVFPRLQATSVRGSCATQVPPSTQSGLLSAARNGGDNNSSAQPTKAALKLTVNRAPFSQRRMSVNHRSSAAATEIAGPDTSSSAQKLEPGSTQCA
eukprot:TRINITY_DN747_c0_g2_i1.p2 TRINITY_DN747_c0_g2~~TRINITY_DN747_c0_g2_i1.p2  ORF type:complete len:134 (+),score=29.26 TRINITY_DN747_c0_g2_i1:1311-1712(+)